MTKINNSVDTMLIVTLADNYRKCLYFNECGKEENYNGGWKNHWLRHEDGFICHKHYSKLYDSKRPFGWWNKFNSKHKTQEWKTTHRKTYETNKKFNSRRTKKYIKKYNDRQSQRIIIFLGKKILLPFKLRKGFCSWCDNNIYDGSCKVTNNHHYFYIPIMVWACTVELCPSCHGCETIKNITRDEIGKWRKNLS